MSIEANKRLVREFYDAGNRGDLDGCIKLLADDVTWTNMGSTPYSGTSHGKGALMANLLGPVFGKLRSGIRSALDNVVAEGEYVVVESRGSAETTDGRAYNNTYCHVFRVRDRLIAEVREYLDTQLANDVLGAR
jgi:ketosteroid isomerase-like protein